jgi:formyl-CoA transferase
MDSIPMHNVVPRLSGTPGALRTPAPSLGQHNAEVLAGLGYGPDEVARLVEAGVLGSAPP